MEQPLEIPVTVDQLNQDISTTDGPKTTATEETLDISVPPKYNYKPGRECINCAGLVSQNTIPTAQEGLTRRPKTLKKIDRVYRILNDITDLFQFVPHILPHS